ncbi:MAG: HNH endonuclease [Candidatus Lokiarchaeota archaeon]|nr:HNH endonuclease [Candidatus Lokiarchaeota archaeon]
MRYLRLRFPIQVYGIILVLLLLIFMVKLLGYHLIWISAVLLLLAGLFYYLWNKNRWEMIAQLNTGLGIDKKTTYVDGQGYLRWKESNRLCHRDIAWENNIRGSARFGECDIHHKDGNKFHNQPSNLEALTRDQHEYEHEQSILVQGKKYRKVARLSKIYRETHKAYLIANQWIPKSQTIIRDGAIYIPNWLYKEKGFG